MADSPDKTSPEKTTSEAGRGDANADGTPPPPPNPSGSQQGGDNTAASQVQSGGSRRRRGQPEGERLKRKAPTYDAPEVPGPCAECGKQFLNWKALFGHMRSHPNREWRGAFPPPIFSPPPSPEKLMQQQKEEQGEALASDLLKIGQRILDQEKAKDESSRGLGIDLNEEPPAASSSNEEEEEAALEKIDLNKEASEGSGGSTAN